jgi:hypothetical protein
MHSHHDFHRTLALDRQSQLLRDAGYDDRAAPHLAEAFATERGEIADRQQARRFTVATTLFTRAARRRLARTGLSGV